MGGGLAKVCECGHISGQHIQTTITGRGGTLGGPVDLLGRGRSRGGRQRRFRGRFVGCARTGMRVMSAMHGLGWHVRRG